MTSKLSCQHGFSLMEVLVSILVISISFVSVMKLQSYVELRSEQNDKQLHAMRIAQAQIDLWDNVGGPAPCHGGVLELTLDNVELCKTDFGPFAHNISQVAYKDSAGKVLRKRLQVDVIWADRSGHKGTVSLVSTQTQTNSLINSN